MLRHYNTLSAYELFALFFASLHTTETAESAKMSYQYKNDENQLKL